ncbi:MAG: PDZ domain-containing protein [Clostridia bacterium]|nr:PDZ domain-containing protein [Clostridia bacterium]
MSYFDKPSRPPYLLIVVLMLFSAIVGGLVSYTIAPAVLGDSGGDSPGQVLPQEQSPPLPGGDPPISTGEDSPVVAIAKSVGPAVIGITNMQGTNFFSQPVSSSGSGFIVDGEKGYAITNNHVVEGAQRLLVSVSEDEQFPAEIVGQDPKTDLAVIKIKADKKLPQVALGDSNKVLVGEMVVAIGNPLGKEFARSVTVGYVSALNRQITVPSTKGGQEISLSLLQTDAAINPGNSGGPLVNTRGEVIGINSVKISLPGVEGMGFSIPITDARPIVEQILDKGYVSRPFIGIYNFREITAEMSQWYDIPQGIFIGGVVQGSPAAKAGIKPEDIIVEMGGQRIASFADLDAFLAKQEVGDKVSIAVVRDGKRREVNLTLGEMPQD